MSKNNLICGNAECGKEHFVAKYSTVNGVNCTDRFSKTPLVCDACGSPLLMITKWDGGAPTFGKIASMTPVERQKVLQKRSNEHYKKEIHDKKVEIDRGYIEKSKEKMGL